MRVRESESLMNGHASNLLHNIGGPRSRQVSERVQSSMLEKQMLSLPEITCCIILPFIWENDLESWLLGLAKAAGYKNWPDIHARILLPSDPMLVFNRPHIGDVAEEPAAILFAALVLARSNEHRYIPGSPPVFTRNRLARKIILKKINTTNFYEMD